MIGQLARRGLLTQARVNNGRSRHMSVSTMGETQKQFQKGSTPYLRGDADPTYLRKASDAPLAAGIFGACIVGWVFCGYNIVRVMSDDK